MRIQEPTPIQIVEARPEPLAALGPGPGPSDVPPPAAAGDTAWQRWLASPPGRYLLRWEHAQLAELVSDVFGFHAVQLGLPELDALAANRMPHRLRVGTRAGGEGAVALDLRVAGYEELPFDAQSVDLVVLAHQLEFSEDPHQVLREVDRILRPEGRLVVVGLNPLSLWGLRQSLQRFMPIDGQLIGVPRVRDWMKLLSFEIDGTYHGCFAPPARTEQWLERMRFFERAGDRWWPICGAVYIVSAVKRVGAMRLVGPVWRSPAARATAPAVAVSGRTCSRGSAVVLPFRRRP